MHLLRQLWARLQKLFQRPDPRYQDLLTKARGDKALVERLIDYERQRNPQAGRREWLRSAIYRWERDNR